MPVSGPARRSGVGRAERIGACRPRESSSERRGHAREIVARDLGSRGSSAASRGGEVDVQPAAVPGGGHQRTHGLILDDACRGRRAGVLRGASGGDERAERVRIGVAGRAAGGAGGSGRSIAAVSVCRAGCGRAGGSGQHRGRFGCARIGLWTPLRATITPSPPSARPGGTPDPASEHREPSATLRPVTRRVARPSRFPSAERRARQRRHALRRTSSPTDPAALTPRTRRHRRC